MKKNQLKQSKKTHI